MKILIGQPKKSNNLSEFIDTVFSASKVEKIDCVLFPEGYVNNEELIEELYTFSQKHMLHIITGYLSNI